MLCHGIGQNDDEKPTAFLELEAATSACRAPGYAVQFFPRDDSLPISFQQKFRHRYLDLTLYLPWGCQGRHARLAVGVATN